ncbi:hypothetical protein [Peribacillus deserti]|uniref:Uncharacterized protein n=1 Tax=Peribacillus deserti TaxID=673318 RepID=A0A2N5M5B4_9BACI|nr:hypothetical protein [Peribacillus deserti]PLT29554.1 hypothetical protein CUU66_12605 [Peribacillus deserti]
MASVSEDRSLVALMRKPPSKGMLLPDGGWLMNEGGSSQLDVESRHLKRRSTSYQQFGITIPFKNNNLLENSNI